MVGVVAGLWGLFGGFAVEGLELYAAVRRHGRWPWKPLAHLDAGETPEAGAAAYVIAEVVRLLIGAGLAWAAAATGQVTGPLGALGVGVAAPTIIGQLAKAIPLASPERQPDPGSLAAIATGPSRSRGVSDVPAAEPGAATGVMELCARTLSPARSSP
jgi:uncharacterized protein (DUF1501 family)